MCIRDRNLITEITFSVMQRKEAALDTLKMQIVELEKSFVKEKTEFDRYTQYIHKRQTFKRAWDRSYIQIHLDERGDIYLSSNCLLYTSDAADDLTRVD